MSDPRVLFVSRTRYRLPLEGSVRRKWDLLAARLDVRVLATAADGRPGADAGFRLVGSPRLPGAGTAAFYLSLPFRVARELRAFRPAVVVAQSPYEAAAALAGRRLAGSRTRVLLEVHGDWRTATRLYGSPFRRLAEPLSRLFAREAVRRVDAVRTLSPFTTGLVRELGVEPAATFTAYVDLSSFTARPPVPLPGAPALLFVGVLERYKDVHTLAAAWRLAARRVPDARLRVIGRGRERGVVEALVRDLPQRVSWSEQVPSEEVATALDAATALVLPSRSEGLPRIAMEAFVRGRPVVGSRAGGIPDIVEDGVSGLLVPPGEPAALAEALVRVLTDPALAQRLAAGAAASSATWLQSPEEYADRMRSLVDELRA
jgi:glycosyltransferase involved in cell wall biosynthesis